MTKTAKLFANGRSQAVRLPSDFRFEGKQVFIRRDPATGDVILSQRPSDWRGLLIALENAAAPDDFLDKAERDQASATRDPFAGWAE
jgi:antitoxin VapB